MDIYEDKVQKSHQRECLACVESKKLRELLFDMLQDRAYFNSYWEHMVKNLKDRKKFLLDMIERSSQAFSQGSDFMDNFKRLTKRRAQDREAGIADMLKMKRQIDANRVVSTFLGGKGQKRTFVPLEEREILRRNNFKRQYDKRLNFYRNILSEIKTLTGVKVKDPHGKVSTKSLKFLTLIDNNGYQLFNFLHEIDNRITKTRKELNEETTHANVDINKRNDTRAFFQSHIEELHKTLNDEIEMTLKVKNSRSKFDAAVAANFDVLLEIMTRAQCDLKPVKALLGDKSQITARNMFAYLRALEKRLNDMLAYVYCDDRRGQNILMENEDMTVRSLRRAETPIVKLEDVILTTQCPECGELEDVNRFDDKLVSPLDENTIARVMASKYTQNELASRMHNLLACNLPRSGIVASRRYAE